MEPFIDISISYFIIHVLHTFLKQFWKTHYLYSLRTHIDHKHFNTRLNLNTLWIFLNINSLPQKEYILTGVLSFPSHTKYIFLNSSHFPCWLQEISYLIISGRLITSSDFITVFIVQFMMWYTSIDKLVLFITLLWWNCVFMFCFPARLYTLWEKQFYHFLTTG